MTSTSQRGQARRPDGHPGQPLHLSNEGEESSSGGPGPVCERSAPETAHTDTKPRVRRARKSDLLETVLGEACPNLNARVRLTVGATTCPDHEATGRHQRRQRRNGAPHVIGPNVAEHPACHHHVCWRHVEVGVHQASVCGPHLNVREPELGRLRPPSSRQFRVQLRQNRANVAPYLHTRDGSASGLTGK